MGRFSLCMNHNGRKKKGRFSPPVGLLPNLYLSFEITRNPDEVVPRQFMQSVTRSYFALDHIDDLCFSRISHDHFLLLEFLT